MCGIEIKNRVISIKDKHPLSTATSHVGFSFAFLKSSAFIHFVFSSQETMNVNIFHYAIKSYAYWEVRIKCT